MWFLYISQYRIQSSFLCIQIDILKSWLGFQLILDKLNILYLYVMYVTTQYLYNCYNFDTFYVQIDKKGANKRCVSYFKEFSNVLNLNCKMIIERHLTLCRGYDDIVIFYDAVKSFCGCGANVVFIMVATRIVTLAQKSQLFFQLDFELSLQT